MKKLLIATLACLMVLGISTTAKATLLLPDTATDITDTAPSDFGTQLVTDYTQVVGYDSISGMLHQDVWLNGTGMLFRYQFVRDDTTGNRLRTMTMTNFTGFTTDVDAYNVGSEELPHRATRQVMGDTITYTFENGSDLGMGAGITSAYMWIQTDAKYLTMGNTNFINGGVWAVPTWSPAVVPEPATMMLFGMGVLGLFGFRKKRVLS